MEASQTQACSSVHRSFPVSTIVRPLITKVSRVGQYNLHAASTPLQPSHRLREHDTARDVRARLSPYRPVWLRTTAEPLVDRLLLGALPLDLTCSSSSTLPRHPYLSSIPSRIPTCTASPLSFKETASWSGTHQDRGDHAAYGEARMSQTLDCKFVNLNHLHGATPSLPQCRDPTVLLYLASSTQYSPAQMVGTPA